MDFASTLAVLYHRFEWDFLKDSGTLFCYQLSGILFICISLLGHQKAIADVLWDTSINQAFSNVASQRFTDFDDAPVLSFDDVIVSSKGWKINRFTAFGVEDSEGGVPGANLRVVLGIFQAPQADRDPLFLFTGEENNDEDLVFDLDGFFLPAGTYWVSAYVERPYEPGLQWFWHRAISDSHLHGNEAVLHDPYDLSGRGVTQPTPHSVMFGTASDLSFRIEGVQVPEVLSPAVVLLTGAIGMACFSKGS